MKNKSHSDLKNVSGFTLIELIIVLAILGLLAALAVPRFAGILDNSKIKTDQANLTIVQTSLEIYKADNEGKSPVLAEGEGNDFDKVVAALHKAGYLKEDKIEQKSGGSFGYQNGEVTFTPPANAES